jgi:hypothetical protein
MSDGDAVQQKHRVQVWFGDYTAEPALAERYAHAMSRRYGLPVTNRPIGNDQPPDTK